MTARSTRQAAEQAIINAAYSYISCPTGGVEEFRTLAEAVEEHHRLGLAELNHRGTTSNNSTDTSGEAAASLGDIAGLAITCFDEIVSRGGLTCDQLEVILARPHQTVSARVNDLRDKGWIVDSSFRRKTRSNRNAIVWSPSQAALKAQP